MERNIPLRFSSRALIGVLGVVLMVALYHPLELDDLPYGLQYEGRGPLVLWSVCGVLWLAVAFRLDGVCAWARKHRAGLLRLARHGGVYYGLILVGLFHAMYLAAGFSLGYWPPLTMQYDPAGIPASAVFHMLICVWFWYWPLALALPCGQFGYALGRGERRAAFGHMTDLVATLALAGLAAAWLGADPLQFMSWFLD